MTSAYRSPPLRLIGGSEAPLELLAGDFHCHVSPPDGPSHVARGLAATVDLAKREGLDFVVLTPHVRARFYQYAEGREMVLAEQQLLRDQLSEMHRGNVNFFVGFEYTDFESGHVGTAFGDLPATLKALPMEEARAQPELFFERYLATGGLLVINHPLLLPVDSFIPIQTWDLSWRPLFDEGPFSGDIQAAHRLAQSYEAYNLAIAHLRDRYLLREEERSIVDSLAAFDREILEQQRRITPIGGSDSHSFHLRATTWVLSRGRSAPAIREAVVRGRTCVRSPEACSLFVRAGDRTVGVGGAVEGVSEIQAWLAAAPLKSSKRTARIFAGEKTIRTKPQVLETISVPADRCSLIRAQIGAGFSAPIYVNCPFARSP